VTSFIKRFFNDEPRATVIEYVLIAGLVCVVIIAAAAIMGAHGLANSS
jgi:Flp pilus assembly pilin Flp